MKPIFISISILISAILAIYFDGLANIWLFGILKGLTTILIIIFCYQFSNIDKSFNKRILVGLFFCLIGDILLVDADLFVFGLGAFLVAHLFFFSAFYKLNPKFDNLFVLVVLLGIGGFIFSLLLPNLNELMIPVLVYFLVIMAMSWKGISLYLQSKKLKYLYSAIGVVLFMISDGIIGLSRFYTKIPHAGIFILIFYWLGIYLIAYSTRKTKLEKSKS